jgi:hypothetical protein
MSQVSSKETIDLPKTSKDLHMPFTAMKHMAEGLCLNAVLMLKVENSLICLAGTGMPAVSKMAWQFIWPMEIFIVNKAYIYIYVVWNKVF